MKKIEHIYKIEKAHNKINFLMNSVIYCKKIFVLILNGILLFINK